MAKKAPKRAQADQPTTESRGSAEPSANGESTTTLPPAARPPGEEPAAKDTPNELRQMQLLADTAGRIYRALTRWLTHEQTHIQVLAWITWLFLLGIVGGFAVVLLVLVFRWHPGYTVALVCGSTGFVAGSNLVNRFFRRKR